MALKLITAPTVEPYTTEQLREAWGVDFAEDDAQVTRAGKAARQWVERFLHRSLINTTYDLYLKNWADTGIPDVVRFPYPPLSSVTSVKYQDTSDAQQTLATSVYGTDTASTPGRVYLITTQTWPDLYGDDNALEVVIRFVSGYGATAALALAEREHIGAAIIMVGRDYYENPSLMGSQTYENKAAVSLLWCDRFLGDVDGL